MAATTTETPTETEVKKDNPWLNPKLIAGLIVVFLLLVMPFVGRLFQDADLAFVASSPVNMVPAGTEADLSVGFKANDGEHPLGTDSQGRDMLATLLVATPSTLQVGLVGAGVGMLVGILLGFTAGFLGGKIDAVITTITDATLTIPGLAVLVVAASSVDELTVTTMGLIMALFAWPIPTRLIRSQVLSMRSRGYVPLARMSGTSNAGIMFKEIMPNLLPYLAAGLTSSIAGVILAATGVETLGLGPQRVPTLGTTVNSALVNSALFRGMWWWWGPPLVILILIFVGFFLVNLGLDEVANPRLRKVKVKK